jgi:hypothetical protein
MARSWHREVVDMTAQETDMFIGVDEKTFESRYNRVSFSFSHHLNSDPLFDLSSIVDLALRRPPTPEHSFWSNGTVSVQDTWAAGTDRKSSLQDTLAHISTNDSLVILKHLELDEKFKPTLQRLMGSLIQRSGPRMRDDVLIGRGTLLIASPHRITSYHIDGDTNFLFQIHGRKLLNVFDNGDRTLVSNAQLERYFSGDVSAAVFRPDRNREAKHYLLVGGSAIHIPSTAPHWAQNQDEVSVALSVNFDLRSVARRAIIFRVNRRLRNLGFSPVPPEYSPWKDEVKVVASQLARTLRKYLPPEDRSPSVNH